MNRLALGAALLALLAATAAATVPDPAERLLDAVGRRDPLAVERAARQLGASAIGRIAESGKGGARRAAAFAAPFSPEAPALLDDLATAAGAPDRSAAVVAVRAGQRIARSLDRETMERLEISENEIASALISWHHVARDRHRWADVRVGALEISRDLARLVTDDSTKPVLELITDADPEVRFGALELLDTPLPAAHIERVAARVAGDDDPHVALAAAAALCLGLPLGDPAAPAIAGLGDRGLERIAELVLDRSLPAASRTEAAACLAHAPESDAAAKALAALPRTLPRWLRGQARSLAAKKHGRRHRGHHRDHR